MHLIDITVDFVTSSLQIVQIMKIAKTAKGEIKYKKKTKNPEIHEH